MLRWAGLPSLAALLALLADAGAGRARPAEVLVLSSLVTARPGMVKAGARAAQLSAARGEWEAFQVLVRAGDAPLDVTLTPSPLVGPGGARLALRLFRVALVEVKVPSSGEGAVGWWPDPLIPAVDDQVGEARRAFPAKVATGDEVTAWLEVFVPRAAAAGRYAGTVRVSDGSRTLAEVPVALLVRRFALPATSSLPVTFGFSTASALVGHGLPATTSDGEVRALERRYALAALRHRVSLHGGSFEPAPGIAGGALDTRAYDAEVGPFLDGTADPGGPAEGARWTAFDLRVPARLDGAERRDYTRLLARHLEERGWIDRVFDYTADEPPDAALPGVVARARLVHEAAPQIPRLVTRALHPGLDGVVDIWCPTVNLLDDKPGNSDTPPPLAYQRRRQAHPRERLWWYQACMSHGCDVVGGDYFSGWPSLVIDAPPVAHRVLEWMTYRLGVGGELYYNTVEAYDGDPWRDVRRHGGNGDGTLFYPGRPAEIGGRTPIPIESIRWKRIRDGLEDLEYLRLLEARAGRDVADALARQVAQRAWQFEHRPERLLEVRAAIAERLEGEPRK